MDLARDACVEMKAKRKTAGAAAHSWGDLPVFPLEGAGERAAKIGLYHLGNAREEGFGATAARLTPTNLVRLSDVQMGQGR
jgi:hypothetical protein